MSNVSLLRPRTITFQSSVTKTTTYTGADVELPLAESYAFYTSVSAASGTSPTLDIAIQIKMSDGTYFTCARHAQFTTTGKRRISLRSTMGRGEAGTEGAVADTGGALSQNTPITKIVRTVWTIGGTNPSFTAVMYIVCTPLQGAAE